MAVLPAGSQLGAHRAVEAEPSKPLAAGVEHREPRRVLPGAAAEQKAKTLKAQHNFKQPDASDADSVCWGGQKSL